MRSKFTKAQDKDWIVASVPSGGISYDGILDLSLHRLLDGHMIVKIIASYNRCRNKIYFPAGTSFEFKSE